MLKGICENAQLLQWKCFKSSQEFTMGTPLAQVDVEKKEG